MKIFGLILIAIGVLSFFGSTFVSEFDYAPGVRILGFIIQLALVIGGVKLMSKSNKEPQ